ncbi:MAG: HigA family addiction module antidote protein [Magnetococcales bacterium]|nr:HigA family addiction module antidote protein [Magnetococcales bacterium]
MTIRREDLDRIDFSDVVDTPAATIPFTHPGEILLEDFMRPWAITQYRLAKTMGVPALRISQIVHGKRAITADTALRLARVLGTTPEFWLALQNRYDLAVAKNTIPGLENIVPLCAA